MNNVIEVNFTPEFRQNIARALKAFGYDQTFKMMLGTHFHPTFIKVFLKSIMSKEGW